MHEHYAGEMQKPTNTSPSLDQTSHPCYQRWSVVFRGTSPRITFLCPLRETANPALQRTASPPPSLCVCAGHGTKRVG